MSKSTPLAARLEAAPANGQVAPFPTTASIKAAAAPVKSAARAKAVTVKAAPAVSETKPRARMARAEVATADIDKVKPAAAKAVARPAVRKQAAAAPAATSSAAAKAATAKPASARATARPRRAAAAPDVAVREKAHKPKLVRDSFTMPEQEYALLNQVKKACLKAGFEIKKSELLRIGVAAVSQLDMATLQQVLSELPQLKTGRPKKAEKA